MIIDVCCPGCNGDGWRPKRRILVTGSPTQVFEEDCQTCKGTGTVTVDLNEECDDDD
jgi:DnaJ-class molecular chaperone